MEFHEALIVWAQQKRRRDRGEPFEPARVAPALRTMFAALLEAGETIDPALPEGLAVGLSGVYNVETATDEDILQLAEDMYEDSRRAPPEG